MQGTNWKCECGSELTYVTEPMWPADMGEMPLKLVEDSIVQAGRTVPRGIGLGWDGIHPSVLAGVSDFLLRWIACILVQAEKSGKWHQSVNLVVIVLLPKGDGAYRPIGLLPWLPRL